ncbi:hypothetical protein GQR58_030701 [Nymphon striatum]|nr:hypothetical protein GQR58_030701 [Nymphon striatum]
MWGTAVCVPCSDSGHAGSASDAHEAGNRPGCYLLLRVRRHPRFCPGAMPFHHVLGLLAEQTNCLDVFGQSFKAEVQHFLWRVGDLEQGRSRFVHTGICGLGRKRDSDHQRVDVHVIQFALGFRISCLKAGENLADGMIVELLGHERWYARCST